MSAVIHPTAIIAPGAEIHPSVQIGPYAVIGEHVRIGAHTTVGAHAVIDGWTEIGEENRIFPGAAIGLESQDKKTDGSLSVVRIGDRNRIREYVTINRATKAGEATVIGNDNLLMAYVHVAHNCILHNRIVISNAVSLAGHIVVESGAVIGGMSGLHQFVHVGRNAMIGGMSRVERDVPPYMLVEGNPARVRSLNLVGLERAGLRDGQEGEAFKQLKQAYRLLYRSDLLLKEAIAEIRQISDLEHLQHLCNFLEASQGSERRGPTPGSK
ncbi:acyl-ACP--UDP-N-acetylglucosamine O-acyltransferase [Synechococcus elongatus]|uniref:Acyl-[acyl-carrier-protein]--UDP-N-acetylglucosamine O-acyltransferase n=1 Tax=Synechococcus elongatus (strain ATCC 33912 / PCC 7942 / FACHB-805) TaxID=1140 RepID=Q31PQ8_SYNE7|nr:acyl-ACP--UDP-N-acetylglucosamine O-acyltransferase [Synechococcus elongatus]MBD2688857.1 acyl-ACP--UDP-N-acetylglucosamine O-acyltransferase [Synechococcus elongatus FACHB-1061]ABB56961.1 acyl-[acyl-carrier-protein]--UDP-N-acetylglucosamine O-acyltransferase [Synechococcus elongatus PCC 7942 = FACHB-805]AJD58515.1 UDP-N-acetylglucosamine acyltransferase [Synechococcus elongatus UTEX 2973]MBD2587364.1 acyl-ACP--UDP-N-acetylglucosamine O-acyltransferase [Synechococcus elongatus FACHB-242]MBD